MTIETDTVEPRGFARNFARWAVARYYPHNKRFTETLAKRELDASRRGPSY